MIAIWPRLATPANWPVNQPRQTLQPTRSSRSPAIIRRMAPMRHAAVFLATKLTSRVLKRGADRRAAARDTPLCSFPIWPRDENNHCCRRHGADASVSPPRLGAQTEGECSQVGAAVAQCGYKAAKARAEATLRMRFEPPAAAEAQSGGDNPSSRGAKTSSSG